MVFTRTAVLRRELLFQKIYGGERSFFMFKEFTETAVSKAKEDISLPQGILALIAVVSFIVGLTVGILCASGAKSRKEKKRACGSNCYAPDFDFEDEDDDEGYEYSF